MSNKSNEIIIKNFIDEVLQQHFILQSKYKLEFNIIEKLNKYNFRNEKKDSVIFSTEDGILTVAFPELDKSYTTEVFGLYVNNSNTFSWSWALPSYFYGKSELSKKLFDFYYEKDITTKHDIVNFYLRNIFITSRINVRESEEMELIIAISEYILKETNQFKFIMPQKKFLSDNPEDFIIIYHFIKFKN